jgi:diacylglycerol kinase (ATP)
MQTLVILNPNAGSADEVPRLRQLVAGLPDLEVRETEGPGHAEALARDAVRSGCRTVVSAGGDGTLNEVLNGLAEDFSAARLGVLPLGTGNDFARTIHVPAEPEAAVQVLHRGCGRRIDVARCTWGDGEQRYFVNMSVGGFAAAVHQAMDPELKRRWGSLSYARSAAEALTELAAYRSRLTFDGGEELDLDLYLLVVANARFVASGIPAAPTAEPDDGALDVIAFPEMPPGQIAALVPRTLLGNHQDDERLTFRRTRSLRVESEPPMPFNVDGEPCAMTPVTFELLPRALEVLVGPDEAGAKKADEAEAEAEVHRR